MKKILLVTLLIALSFTFVSCKNDIPKVRKDGEDKKLKDIVVTEEDINNARDFLENLDANTVPIE